MQVQRTKAGIRFYAQFCFKLGGEIMASKPRWMSRLEEEQSKKLILTDQAKEVAASHRKILDTTAPDLWEKIRDAVHEALQSSELRGLSFTVQAVGENSVMVSMFRPGEVNPLEVVYVSFIPEKYTFQTIDRNQRTILSRLYLGVSSGQVLLSDEKGMLSDDEGEGLVNVACQRLLEPLLRPYV